MHSIPALATLAAQQDAVVTRAQLRDLGITRGAVQRRVEAGAWRALGPRVVVLHRGPLAPSQRWWVGALHAGPGGALAGWSAAEAEGLRGFEAAEVTVAIAHGSEKADLEHEVITVRVRQTRRLADFVHPMRRPPRLRLAVALVQAVSEARSTDQLRAALAASVQQRLLRPDALHAAATELTSLRQRRLILATIAEVAGGAHSLPELEYASAVRRAGLPPPTRQRVVRRPGGTYYLDNDFEPWEVVVEINGAQHLNLRAREYDDARRQALQEAGKIVVDLSSYVVRARSGEAVLRTASALLAKGWTPSFDTRRLLAAAAEELKWTGGWAA